MDVERLQEALKGTDNCPLFLPPHPPQPSLFSLQGGWLRGPGLGTGEKVRLPGSLPPLASLGAGALWAAPSRPLWALCPTLASRLGEGSWGKLSLGPIPCHTLPGSGRGPAAPS